MGSWKEEVPIVFITQEQVEENLQCYICLDDLVAGEPVMKLNCSHHYHELCITPWLDKHNVCPTCRQKILCREDPDEEYDLEFDSSFLTDIITEINNIVFGAESDEEFLFSDSPDIIDITSSDTETVLSEEYGTSSERNSTNQESSVSDDGSDDSYDQEQESNVQDKNNQPVITEEVGFIDINCKDAENCQNRARSVKRTRSWLEEVEDSSDDEEETVDNSRCFLRDGNESLQNSLSSKNIDVLKERVSYNVTGNSHLKKKNKFTKRQKYSSEFEGRQDSEESSDEEFSGYDIPNISTESKFSSLKESNEKKQSVRDRENFEENKKNPSKYVEKSPDGDESDDGVFVIDMGEVESLVSKLLDIMNENDDDDDENSSNQDEILGERKSKINEDNSFNTVNDEDTEISDDEDAELDDSYVGNWPSGPEEFVSKEGVTKSSVLRDTQTVVNNLNNGTMLEQKREFKTNSVKRKSCSSDSESSNDEGDSINCDDFVKIERIISELWSIVGEDIGETESDQNDVSEKKISTGKLNQRHSRNEVSPKRHKKSHHQNRYLQEETMEEESDDGSSTI